ncbi:ABC transporter substrate-binding protein [Streptomyces sp. JJ36]|uniref:ABC transporter substrate-binding protein n=1 Tax=Streptomyces sp. JJ36 TaxID=2736645 RepID=UPI001F1E477B|nr:iron-siderophore ABC transporter substrate-binding protein [Streptomyces sp. JJ36]MCF6524300.1 iron-siderophore ABC transporter substrate-binding protein [Streptomyces sp. JJ36]
MSTTAFHRRAVLTGTAVALALTATACGGSEDGKGGSQDAGGATHTVSTAMGEVEVPEDPQRVVVLDTDALDSAVTLGVQPVGAVAAEPGRPLSTYLPEKKLKGVETVGTIGTPNLEKINSLDPDLILSSKVRDEKNYDKLSAIAPTVFTETTGPTWRENFTLHAEALGEEKKAEQVVADYEQHIEEVRETLGGPEQAKKSTVGFVRFIEGADIRLYKNDTFIGSIFQDLGVGRPENQDGTGFSLDVSPEQIDKAQADIIFYSTYGDPEKADETKVTRSGLWKGLDAVQNDRAFRVDDNLWMLGIGYTGAGQILDQMEKHLGGSDA